jgi:SP family sugar:H+ symporter-like MFS transporter
MHLPFSRNRNADHSNTFTAVSSNANSIDLPGAHQQHTAGGINNDVDHPEKSDGAKRKLVSVPITLRTIVMALLVAMGGFIFGYDTGQISGFLEMDVFLRRFGQPTTDLVNHPNGFYFTNVRSGLIVGLVCLFYMYFRSILT